MSKIHILPPQTSLRFSPAQKVISALDSVPDMPELYDLADIEKMPLDQIKLRLHSLGVDCSIPPDLRNIIDNSNHDSARVLPSVREGDGCDHEWTDDEIRNLPLSTVVSELNRHGINYRAGLERIRELVGQREETVGADQPLEVVAHYRRQRGVLCIVRAVRGSIGATADLMKSSGQRVVLALPRLRQVAPVGFLYGLHLLLVAIAIVMVAFIWQSQSSLLAALACVMMCVGLIIGFNSVVMHALQAWPKVARFEAWRSRHDATSGRRPIPPIIMAGRLGLSLMVASMVVGFFAYDLFKIEPEIRAVRAHQELLQSTLASFTKEVDQLAFELKMTGNSNSSRVARTFESNLSLQGVPATAPASDAISLWQFDPNLSVGMTFTGVAPPERFAGVATPVRFAGVAPPEWFAGVAPPERFAGVAAPVRFASVAPPEWFAGVAPRSAFHAGFRLLNETKYQMVYVSNRSSNVWGKDIMASDALADGGLVNITFPHGGSACEFDIKVVYHDGDKPEFDNVNLCDHNKITLFWDAKNQTTKVVAR